MAMVVMVTIIRTATTRMTMAITNGMITMTAYSGDDGDDIEVAHYDGDDVDDKDGYNIGRAKSIRSLITLIMFHNQRARAGRAGNTTLPCSLAPSKSQPRRRTHPEGESKRAPAP